MDKSWTNGKSIDKLSNLHCFINIIDVFTVGHYVYLWLLLNDSILTEDIMWKPIFLGFSSVVITAYCVNPELPENRLHHELLHLRSYSKLIRPVSNHSVQLTVKMGLRLSQLLDIVSLILKAYKTLLHRQTVPFSP